jgi:hypothetical protein
MVTQRNQYSLSRPSDIVQEGNWTLAAIFGHNLCGGLTPPHPFPLPPGERVFRIPSLDGRGKGEGDKSPFFYRRDAGATNVFMIRCGNLSPESWYIAIAKSKVLNSVREIFTKSPLYPPLRKGGIGAVLPPLI